jgi:RNA-directed DNA polymerase
MNLESDKRLNIQLRLDFSSTPTGEARQAGREDIESLSVVSVESWRKYVNEQT